VGDRATEKSFFCLWPENRSVDRRRFFFLKGTEHKSVLFKKVVSSNLVYEKTVTLYFSPILNEGRDCVNETVYVVVNVSFILFLPGSYLNQWPS